MALVKEDGSGTNPAANTYADVADIRAYAAERGITLPTADGDVEVMAIKAMDFVEGKRDLYQGRRTSQDQPLQWPRIDVTVDGFPVASDEIPRDLVNGQCSAAVEAESEDLQPTRQPTSTGAITREKVAGIEVEYAEPSSSISTPVFTKAESWLSSLYKQHGLRLVRV